MSNVVDIHEEVPPTEARQISCEFPALLQKNGVSIPETRFMYFQCPSDQVAKARDLITQRFNTERLKLDVVVLSSSDARTADVPVFKGRSPEEVRKNPMGGLVKIGSKQEQKIPANSSCQIILAA